MKYVIILGDGMADEPIAKLGGKTPLQVANKPTIDRLAKMGRNGLLHTVPDGFQPGSEIANLSVLGYDVPNVFEGRGTLEAASMGVPIADGEMVMRCNLICIENGKIKNHSAGHISNEEARTDSFFATKFGYRYGTLFQWCFVPPFAKIERWRQAYCLHASSRCSGHSVCRCNGESRRSRSAINRRCVERFDFTFTETT